MKKNHVPFVVLFLGTIFIFVGLYVYLFSNKELFNKKLSGQGYYHFNRPEHVGSSILFDLNGNQTTLPESQKSWQLVNFGYMFCPDICPINLRFISDVKHEWDALGKNSKLGITHITFDPERDTVDRLKPYLNYYHNQYIGLTGSVENIQTLASQLHTVFMYEKPDEYGNYTISHNDTIALLNPSGQFVGMFKGPYNHYDVAAVITTLQKVIQ
jgi:protein SCO1/2